MHVLYSKVTTKISSFVPGIADILLRVIIYTENYVTINNEGGQRVIII